MTPVALLFFKYACREIASLRNVFKIELRLENQIGFSFANLAEYFSLHNFGLVIL